MLVGLASACTMCVYVTKVYLGHQASLGQSGAWSLFFLWLEGRQLKPPDSQRVHPNWIIQSGGLGD